MGEGEKNLAKEAKAAAERAVMPLNMAQTQWNKLSQEDLAAMVRSLSKAVVQLATAVERLA